MDVTLVLTHRCNLACTYCYAGEHHRTAIDDATLERAVALLWADSAKVAQLSFFGGEPFLQFERMRRAVELARASEAAVPGRRLLLQCTTNGTLLGPREVAFVRRERMRVAVSIDGVREAHELQRPRAGSASSFSSVYRGLRALCEAGCAPEALLVITPATALFLFRSVRWLWDEGVEVVRANLDVRASWSPEFRGDLNDELVALGRELLHRRLRGRPVAFEPFEAALQRADGASAACAGAGADATRARVVVGTTGNLYPCSPMVGEDRAHGPEAGVRLGHLDDGAETIVARVRAEGVSCGAGRACACAAWLETGDRHTPGAHSRWFGKLCHEVGTAVAAGLAQATSRRVPGDLDAPLPPARTQDEPDRTRRRALVGLALGAGGLALAQAGLVQIRKRAPVVETPPPTPPPTEHLVLGEMPAPPPEPPPATEPRVDIAGGIGDSNLPEPPPPEPPPPKPPREHKVMGQMPVHRPPPEETIEGDMAAPFYPETKP